MIGVRNGRLGASARLGRILELIESLGAHQLFELAAEAGGVVGRGRLGGRPVLGSAVRHGREGNRRRRTCRMKYSREGEGEPKGKDDGQVVKRLKGREA